MHWGEQAVVPFTTVSGRMLLKASGQKIGQNDNGPYDSGRARASIPGIGKDSLNVTIQETGVQETVYSYGEYMRRFVQDVKAKGAHPILFSLTPRNAWEDKDSTEAERV